jgi:YVTN family beta-propeller protein
VRKNESGRFILAAAIITLLLSGCGDTFRPVANPIPQPGGDPGFFRRAVFLENNGGAPNSGGTDNFDVSGDTNVGFVAVGRNPVFLALSPDRQRAWVSNQADDSLSSYPTAATTSGAVTTTLPAGSQPGFLASTESDLMFVAETGTSRVAAVSASSLVFTGEVVTPAAPKILVELPNQAKLYSINVDGSISDIVPKDFSVAPVTFASGGTDPRWALATPDSTFLFVFDGASNTIFAVNTSNDSVTPVAAPGLSTPIFAQYDNSFKRLYIINAGTNSVSVLDATSPPALPPVTASPIPVGSGPVQLTVLADGSRVYVANSAGNSVSVINANSLTVTKTIAVGANPVSIASSGDSSRVYVASRNTAGAPQGTIGIIQTANDTDILNPHGTLANPILVVAD